MNNPIGLKPRRFGYEPLDEKSIELSNLLERLFEDTVGAFEAFPDSREKAIALTKLEESHHWISKAIINDQRAGHPPPA